MATGQSLLVKELIKELHDESLHYLGVYDTPARKLSCKELAKSVNVTSATISNLTTDSKLSLVYDVCYEIYNYYFDYFSYMQNTFEDYANYNYFSLMSRLYTMSVLGPGNW